MRALKGKRLLTPKSAAIDFISSLYVFLIAIFIFYVCSSVYFTVSAIAMPLLLSHDLHVRLLRVVQ